MKLVNSNSIGIIARSVCKSQGDNLARYRCSHPIRIYKTEQDEKGLIIHFRFWGNNEEVEELFSHKNVLIDGMRYHYTTVDKSYVYF